MSLPDITIRIWEIVMVIVILIGIGNLFGLYGVVLSIIIGILIIIALRRLRKGFKH